MEKNKEKREKFSNHITLFTKVELKICKSFIYAIGFVLNFIRLGRFLQSVCIFNYIKIIYICGPKKIEIL